MQKIFSRHKKLCALSLIIIYSAFLLIYSSHTHKLNFHISNIYIEQVSSQNSVQKDYFLDNFGNCLIQQFSQTLISLDYVPHQFIFLQVQERLINQSQSTNIFVLTNNKIPRAPPLI